MLPLTIASRMRVAEADQCGCQRRDRERNRLAGQRRDAAGELGREVFGRQGEAREPPPLQFCGQIGDERQQLALQVEGRGQVRAGLAEGLPALLGFFGKIAAFSCQNRHIRHRLVIIGA
jgi:hypothetical protein